MYSTPYYQPYWLSENELEHYGVLGMKWGVRKDKVKAFNKAGKKLERLRNSSLAADRRYNKSKNRSRSKYKAAIRAGKRYNAWYDKMQDVFSKVKFSDLEKSKLNKRYIGIGNNIALLNSLWSGDSNVKWLVADLKDIGIDYDDL